MAEKVLIVDKDQDYINQFKKQSGTGEWEILYASNQKESIDIISKEKISIALFSLILDNDDTGLFLSYRLRKIKPQVPIILLIDSNQTQGVVFNLSSDDEKFWVRADFILEKSTPVEQMILEVNRLIASGEG